MKRALLLLLFSARCAAPDAPARPAAPATPPSTAFAIDVRLSPAAAAKLAAAKETVIVSGDYFGLPAQGVPVDMTGTLPLGRQTVELFGAGLARFDAANADPSRLKQVRDGDVHVLINVFSGRRSSDDNLLDCGIFQDSTRLATRTPVRIDCKLLGES